MMKLNLVVTLFLISQLIHAQNRKEYLLENRIDLRRQNTTLLTETDFGIIGFGAYHGSAKTYEAELIMLRSLAENRLLDYYIIEGNMSQAYFFQQYLNNGDEDLLKDLVKAYQTIVTQEGTIETYQFWQALRSQTLMCPDKPLKVMGFDIIWEYKFPIRHILELTQNVETWEEREDLKELFSKDKLDFSVWGNQTNEVSKTLKTFVTTYLSNQEDYKRYVIDLETFNFLITNLNHNFQEEFEKDQNRIDREKIIFDNFISLNKMLSLKDKKLFAKYGVFHIQKNREDDYPSFFTRLIEKNIYDKNRVISINCFLVNSKSLGRKIYDEKGNYKSYSIYSGSDLDDSWKSHYKGIRQLKKVKLSDLTLFKLNKNNSPYANKADLIELRVAFKDYNSSNLEGKNTLQFIDYALLITDSKEQIPIEEMK